MNEHTYVVDGEPVEGFLLACKIAYSLSRKTNKAVSVLDSPLLDVICTFYPSCKYPIFVVVLASEDGASYSVDVRAYASESAVSMACYHFQNDELGMAYVYGPYEEA